ncbi:hypothetical protein ACEPAI_2444 [Sanghuangporus weigelae]
MDSAIVIPVPVVDKTLGCLFLALVFSSVLWGAGCLQLYFYYEKYWKTDQQWLKAYIFVIWTLDTAHQVLIVQFNYMHLVRGVADATLLTAVSKTGIDTAILAAIIDTMIQIIFVRRAWILSNRNRVLTGVLSIAVIGQFAATTTYYGQIYHFNLLTQFVEVVHMELILNCVLTFTDMLIAVSLIWLLRKSRSGIGRTDSVINRLVTYTIGSGFVTGLWTMSALIAAQVVTDSLIYLLIALVFPKLYFNCMLASLNARSRLREALSTGTGGLSIRLENFSSPSTERSNTATGVSHKPSNTRAIECRVDINIESGADQQEAFRNLRWPGK